LGSVSKFTLTVICSSLLSIWLQKEWRLLPPTGKKPVAETGKKSSRSSATSDSDSERSSAQVPVGKMEDLYRKHLQEILHTLRTNSSVRMVKLRLPNSVLKFQRNLASASDGDSFRLEGRTDEIPFIAVSMSAQKFLDQMAVSYIHPKSLPPGLINSSRLPFNSSALTQFLLLPDLSGNNAAFFTFEREPATKKPAPKN